MVEMKLKTEKILKHLDPMTVMYIHDWFFPHTKMVFKGE